MEKFVVTGGVPLVGDLKVSGAKNVALKIPVAALLTEGKLEIENFPVIRDGNFLLEVLQSLGADIHLSDHHLEISCDHLKTTTVPLEFGARLRTTSLVLGPLLARFGEAKVPNPGGCRIGARPIDRHIRALEAMGAEIKYNPTDGFFYGKTKQLHGAKIRFSKNTHTGTEAIILAAVLAEGHTVIENAAMEVEVNDLINCLNQMGAKILRTKERQIDIDGVKTLHGTKHKLLPDRNEEVTFAIAAAITNGRITVRNSQRSNLTAFLDVFTKSGGKVTPIDGNTTTYARSEKLIASAVATAPHPGFMTDWQAPWAMLMTQAKGVSSIHETVFESRFSYVRELVKMGAKIEFYDPLVINPQDFYNFNWSDRQPDTHQAIKISGPTKLHNAIVNIDDLRAGATLLLAALSAQGTSYIYGVEQIDRGYEKIEEKLRTLGAKIKRVEEESI